MSSVNNQSSIRLTSIEGHCTPSERRVLKQIERSVNILWHQAPVAEITAVFVSQLAIQKLNRQYRHVNRSTTTLSFVYQGRGLRSDPWVGEVMFCRAVIKQRALAAGQSYAQALAELAAHSLLHILGYDHQTEAQERTMERWAGRIIKLLP